MSIAMDIRLTIFAGLAFVVLAWNTIFLLVLLLTFRRVQSHADAGGARYARGLRALRTTVYAAERTTTRMAERSGHLRESLQRMNERMDRTDNWARYGLAKFDFNADRLSGSLRSRTRTAARVVGDGLYQTSVVIQGVKVVLALADRAMGGKSGRTRERLRVAEPLDTAATLIQALRAVGQMFRRPEARDYDAPPS